MTLAELRRLSARCRCSFCGSYRNTVSDKTTRLLADEPITLAMLVCEECGHVRLFLVDLENSETRPHGR